MNIPKISKRLEAAASFSRKGDKIADVGTDHAYLPIYLCALGINERGVASDINRGPIDRAKANIDAWGMADKIATELTDGLNGIEKHSPDTVFILGMGGELIVKIISQAGWLKENKRRLVLQPMTHTEIVREYLWNNGFAIVDECIVIEDKIYQVVCAEYCGENKAYNKAELYFGALNIKRGGEALEKLLLRSKKVFSERIGGKLCAGANIDEETEMIKNIDKILLEVKTK